MERESSRSGDSNVSGVSRSTGRYEAKYKVGDKSVSGAIIKEVKEEDWKFVEKDKKGNNYFKCLKCPNAARVLKSNRKTHGCK